MKNNQKLLSGINMEQARISQYLVNTDTYNNYYKMVEALE